MTTKFSVFLETMVRTQTQSIQGYEFEGQKVWLKKASKRHSTWIYLPLQWFSKLLGLSMLAPVPNHGGNAAISCEIQRLTQLRQRGIRVPEILAQQEHAFLIRDAAHEGGSSRELGSTLRDLTDPKARLALYEYAIQTLNDIHEKGSYLSEAFVRNILIDEQKNLTFIDFETDPASVLSLKECQTRDWLCFIFSTAHYFNDAELESASLLLSNTLSSKPQYFADISRVAAKLQWILKLKPEKLGKDGIRMARCIHLLKHLHTEFHALDDKKPMNQ